jgi:hypothetical protein
VLAGRKGPQRKALYVASNDPREPYLQLRLLGTAVEALDVSPRHIDFGVLEQGAATNREIANRRRWRRAVTGSRWATSCRAKG